MVWCYVFIYFTKQINLYLFLKTKLGLWSIAFSNRIWALAFFKLVHLDNVRLFPLAFFTE